MVFPSFTRLNKLRFTFCTSFVVLSHLHVVRRPVERAADNGEELCDVKWFLDHVEHTELQHVVAREVFEISRGHDGLDGGIEFLQFHEEFLAGDAGHAEVRNHKVNVVLFLGVELERLDAVRRTDHRVAVVGEDVGNGVADELFVVDDEDRLVPAVVRSVRIGCRYRRLVVYSREVHRKG